MLPDVGGTIHVQGGGGGAGIGGGYSPDDIKILTEYGLQTGGIISDVDDTTKKAFIEQINSGECSVDSGDSIILKKKCWAVIAVIRALINRDLGIEVKETDAGENTEGLPVPEPPTTVLSTLSTPPPTPQVSEPIQTSTLSTPPSTPQLSEPTTSSTPPISSKPPISPTSQVSNPVQELKPDLQEIVSKVNNRLQLDTNKEEFYTNLNIKGKPTRVRSKTPANIAKTYKSLVGGKRKNKTRKIKTTKSKLRSRRKYRA